MRPKTDTTKYAIASDRVRRHISAGTLPFPKTQSTSQPTVNTWKVIAKPWSEFRIMALTKAALSGLTNGQMV